jgi:hypothetical protein
MIEAAIDAFGSMPTAPQPARAYRVMVLSRWCLKRETGEIRTSSITDIARKL